MRVELRDGYGTYHVITTRNPDTLAAWLVERIGIIRPDHIVPAQILVWPEFHADEQNPQGIPDWIPDSRILGRAGRILRPLDLIRYLQEQIDGLERLDRPDEPEADHAERDAIIRAQDEAAERM